MRLFGRDEPDSPDPSEEEIESYRETIASAKLPAHVEQSALRELEKIAKFHPSTAEYTIGISYLDYLIGLPWSVQTEDRLDIANARRVLDADHYGLEQVKERILEYLAVVSLKKKRKFRVLVVEDEEITRNNLLHVLTKEGYLAEGAANGEEALKIMTARHFDVVLTDWKMGQVDGIQVLEQAKLTNPNIQVVMITGYPSVDSAVEVMRKGAYHYLTKPFKIDDVRRTVNQIISTQVELKESRSPVLCFVGPPGVGKTSLGRSIARSLGRKFIRLSLAGMKDEAEIRGHRRTYAGALPGRIIQEIKRVGVSNPVFMLDEVDKAIQDFKGDATAALLEVLDPEQNANFFDYYLALPFDLSRVFFIATANMTDPIPPALLDRMEVISLSGYTDNEKAEIALRYIAPRQLVENGLNEGFPKLSREAVFRIIQDYTRESGLRNLEREIARLYRKIALEVLTGSEAVTKEISPNGVEQYLGPRRYQHEVADAMDRIGVATGLVWTGSGGEIIFVEATIMKGNSQLILTGSLGDVMRESAQAALSYLRANAQVFNLEENFFEQKDIHIHVPAGAIPKDGPSAGLTIAVALLSLLAHRPVRRDAALSGELTLAGRLLPVGGIREKILAARRAGVKMVVLPTRNQADVEDLTPEALSGLELRLVNSLDEVAEMVLLPPVE
jgi:ATP-dependent Lon protease